jgi:hypothetical protein
LISDATGTLIPGIALVPVTLALGALIWARGWRARDAVAGA